ncbi:bifunctional metallophosphatase/5'-nucleotidase [Sphingomonas sp. RS2018]
MRRLLCVIALAGALGACAPRVGVRGPVEVGIVAINDFHGNLQPPKLAVVTPSGDVPAGGAAYLASAIAELKRGHPNAITVSAGDLTSASPLVSSIFLDEPSVAAMNLIGLDLNAVGNHEFDRGTAELQRLQDGGCAKHTARTPCAIEPFVGARFRYLAGNTITPSGGSLMPGTALHSFGSGAGKVTIGFIGLTTRTTDTLVNPTAIQGLTFADEAETANRLVPALKAAGADAIVLLVHEGGYPKPEVDPNACDGLSGPIVEIAARLDPAISVVVSGHTHKAYICDRPRGGAGSAPILLTSAARYGTVVTDITLTFDPASRRLVGRSARNVVVQGEGFADSTGKAVAVTPALPRFAAEPRVAALTQRYAAAVATLSKRPVGRVTEPLAQKPPEGGYAAKIIDLVADAQLAATRRQGVQVSFMNPTGIRAALTPAADGTVTFGDLYAVQPFGNVLMVREYSGRELLAILEQQFARESGKEMILGVSGMTYAFDRSRPAGARILDPRVGGKPLDPAATYRVVASNFLINGGDEFPAFRVGRGTDDGGEDLAALEAYIAARSPLVPPAADRITDRTPAGWKR